MTDPASPDPDRDPERPADAEQPAPDLAHTSHQPRNPLHGVTLEAMLTTLVEQRGWPWLARQIPARCFAVDPSLASSLKFLRKTPWARTKLEGLYLAWLRRQERAAKGPRK